jgi:hypothetical protein
LSDGNGNLITMSAPDQLFHQLPLVHAYAMAQFINKIQILLLKDFAYFKQINFHFYSD